LEISPLRLQISNQAGSNLLASTRKLL